MAKGKKKNFILDTNVILHDFRCLYNFEENDVYLPIVVLEELDKFKKGNDQINFNAREFMRQLDTITDDKLFSEGTSISNGMGRLFVEVSSKMNERICEIFPEKIPDHHILSMVLEIAEKYPDTKSILVSKDINLRMKARSIGLLAEDYINDKVANAFLFDQQINTYTGIAATVIDKLYKTDEEVGITIDELKLDNHFVANECFILKSNDQSALARFHLSNQTIKRVDKRTCFGIHPRNAEQAFAFELLTDQDIKLVAITGKAGTGKTLLALAAALEQHEVYKQILLARPIVGLSNKDLGFLPGNEQDKIAPYMQPLYDNLGVIKTQLTYNSSDSQTLERIQKENKLEIEALAYIRGRSLSDMICIIDEAQNLTPHEIKTIITRAGKGTKMIFTGDLQQIDSPYLDAQSNGLSYIIDKMRGQDLFAHINLVKGERSRLSELASILL